MGPGWLLALAGARPGIPDQGQGMGFLISSCKTGSWPPPQAQRRPDVARPSEACSCQMRAREFGSCVLCADAHCPARRPAQTGTADDRTMQRQASTATVGEEGKWGPDQGPRALGSDPRSRYHVATAVDKNHHGRRRLPPLPLRLPSTTLPPSPVSLIVVVV